jgi:hypothetical protein
LRSEDSTLSIGGDSPLACACVCFLRRPSGEHSRHSGHEFHLRLQDLDVRLEVADVLLRQSVAAALPAQPRPWP